MGPLPVMRVEPECFANMRCIPVCTERCWCRSLAKRLKILRVEGRNVALVCEVLLCR